MQNKKLVMALGAVLAVLITVFATVYIIAKPDTQDGLKEISVTVVFADKAKKEYSIKTDAEFLAEALLEEKIITEKSVDGLYTVIAGERADYNKDKSWWCLKKDGEMLNNGFNDQPVTDGDSYEIANTPA